MKTETKSPVLIAIDNGHYQKHDEGLCYEDGESWPCRTIRDARRYAAQMPTRLKSDRVRGGSSPFRY